MGGYCNREFRKREEEIVRGGERRLSTGRPIGTIRTRKETAPPDHLGAPLSRTRGMDFVSTRKQD